MIGECYWWMAIAMAMHCDDQNCAFSRDRYLNGDHSRFSRSTYTNSMVIYLSNLCTLNVFMSIQSRLLNILFPGHHQDSKRFVTFKNRFWGAMMIASWSFWMARMNSAVVVDKMVEHDDGNNQHYIGCHPLCLDCRNCWCCSFARKKSIYPWEFQSTGYS